MNNTKVEQRYMIELINQMKRDISEYKEEK